MKTYVVGSGPQGSGGLSSGGLTIGSGDSMAVYSGGVISGIVVDGLGGVGMSGGTAYDTVLNNSQAVLGVGSGAQASGTVVNAGLFDLHVVFSGAYNSALDALSGGSSFDTTLNGGSEMVQTDSTATGTTVNSGGFLNVVDPTAVAINTTINAGGAEFVSDATTSNTVIDGGRLTLGFNAAATGTLAFGSGGGTLQVIDSAMPSVTISGFGIGDRINLTNVGYFLSGSVVLDTTADTLTVNEGGSAFKLQLAGSLTGEQAVFTGTLPGEGGVAITLAPAPCFAKGTRIATARGAIAVEALAVGDMVVTASGAARPIIWIGHRTVEPGRHPNPDAVLPVRVQAHAFGDNQPHRDLILSPDHAVFVEGVLIPVRHLVNGASVARQAAERVAYFHVELDRHDVVLAEGLPCESFLDTGNRAAFTNGGTITQLQPDFATRVWDADSCAELVVAGPHLQRVRGMLRDRVTPEPMARRPVSARR